MKDKSHIIISIHAVKAFDKIQYPLMVKNTIKFVKWEHTSNIIKAMYDKS